MTAQPAESRGPDSPEGPPAALAGAGPFSPRRSGAALPDAERVRNRAFLLLRFTLIVGAAYLLLSQEGWRGLDPGLPTVWIILAAALSNVVLFWVPARWLGATAFVAGVIVIDTLWVTVAFLLAGRFSSEFFYVYFFVLCLAAIRENLRLVATGAIVGCAAYLFLASKAGAGDGLGLSSATLIRIPFFFAVAIVYGYLVDRVRRERQAAGEQAAEARRLEAVGQFEAQHARAIEAATGKLEREVAERQRVEQELRKLSRVVEQSPTMVLIADTAGKIEYVNPRFTTVTGWTAAEVLGRNFDVLVAGEASREHHERLLGAVALGREWHGELLQAKRGGDHFWASVAVSPLRLTDDKTDDKAAHVVLVQQDVTGLKVAEQTLQKANDELKKVSEMKTAFVSTVSHELRTPLTAMKNALDILAMAQGSRRPAGEPPGDDDVEARFLAIAARNVSRLTTIVNDLLDLSKVEAGKLTFHFESVAAPPVLAELAETYAAQAQLAEIELAIVCPEALPAVWADPHRLEQVLANLLGNALKFTPPRGRVSVEAVLRDGMVELSVRDTGVGLPLEEQQRIFRPFYQVESTEPGAGKIKGSGLGLAIARDLVLAQGGELAVESVPGRGSRFFFTVPVESAPAREMSELEEKVAGFRDYPFFGMLIARPAEGGSAAEAVEALRYRLRVLLPRSTDHIIAQPATGRVILAFLATDVGGMRIVHERLARELAAGKPLATVCGPACYPGDGASARQLVAVAETITAVEEP